MEVPQGEEPEADGTAAAGQPCNQPQQCPSSSAAWQPCLCQRPARDALHGPGALGSQGRGCCAYDGPHLGGGSVKDLGATACLREL